MKIDQILDAIRAHPLTIRVYGQEAFPDHEFWRVSYISSEVDYVAKDMAIDILFKVIGDRDSDAYILSIPPYMVTEGEFKTDLEARIAVLSGPADIVFYDIISLDEEKEKAIVRVYRLIGGNLEPSEYGGYRKADESIDFIPIV